MTFKPQRDLLNPKFEGYKLEIADQNDFVTRFNLDHRVSQSILPNNSLLSFAEVQSRVTHNHLFPSPGDQPRAIYIDTDYNLVSITLTNLVPTFHVIYQLPKPLGSQPFHREYPSAAFLSPSEIFASDGYGTLYVLRTQAEAECQLVAVYHLPVFQPFQIHSALALSETRAVLVLSSRNYEASGKTVQFDLWAATFVLPLATSSNPSPMDILWKRCGDRVPTCTFYDPSRNCHLIVSDCLFRMSGEQESSYEPAPSEYAPIPRQDENIDVRSEPGKPPPYSWTQTSDSVTIAFPLLSTTEKSDIQVKFSSRTLDLHVSSLASTPNYSAKELWDGISPSTSYWTWDREGGHSFGLLTLYLDKQHEDTRWMQVFASSATSTSQSNPDDVEVPETLDPSELASIRESLEKYTHSLKTGEDTSGLGLGTGVPSLSKGEMDEEVDSGIGRSSYLTWITNDGTNPSWARNDRGEAFFQLLASPFPGINDTTVSLVVKHDLDGLVFSLLSASETAHAAELQHTSTYSALAFVLASKQDTRFTFHIPSKGVFAFESGLRDRGGNVYIYRPSPAKDIWAKQAILKVADGVGGGLLGAVAMKVDGNVAIGCLLENEFVLIKKI